MSNLNRHRRGASLRIRRKKISYFLAHLKARGIYDEVKAKVKAFIHKKYVAMGLMNRLSMEDKILNDHLRENAASGDSSSSSRKGKAVIEATASLGYLAYDGFERVLTPWHEAREQRRLLKQQQLEEREREIPISVGDILARTVESLSAMERLKEEYRLEAAIERMFREDGNTLRSEMTDARLEITFKILMYRIEKEENILLAALEYEKGTGGEWENDGVYYINLGSAS